jgi:hypothetical protein
MTWPGLELRLPRWKPATNRLSYVMALISMLHYNVCSGIEQQKKIYLVHKIEILELESYWMYNQINVKVTATKEMPVLNIRNWKRWISTQPTSNQKKCFSCTY